MNKVTILTSPTCGYCHAAKNLLRQQGVDYLEVDLIAGGEQARELLRQSGQRTVPQIFINDKPLGGYSELSELIASNEF
ncbi:MAG: glutaredoxin family protein, partial [Gammaproteobacteria bacterium]